MLIKDPLKCNLSHFYRFYEEIKAEFPNKIPQRANTKQWKAKIINQEATNNVRNFSKSKNVFLVKRKEKGS